MVSSVEEDVVTGKHHHNVQQNGKAGKHVQLQSAFAETLEKARSYLQTYHEYEQNKTEVLQEVQRSRWSCKANMTRQNANEKNKGYTERDTAYLYFTKINT